jgi:hypothetical protein
MHDIANGRTVPALTCGMAAVKSANNIDTRPPMMSIKGRSRGLVGHVQLADFGPFRQRVAANAAGGAATGERRVAGIGPPIVDQLLKRMNGFSVKLPTRVTGTKSLIGS